MHKQGDFLQNYNSMLNYKCHVCILWRNGLFAYEGRRKGVGHWGTRARLHSFLPDKLILFQSGGVYYSHPIELYPLLFGKFRRACIQIQVQQLSICQKVLKSLGRPFDLLPNFKEELFFRVDHSSMKLAFLLRPDFSKQAKESCKHGKKW